MSSSSSPLENPLVVRQILSHFGTQELLQLSRINKLWNYEARYLLREHRKCHALIRGRPPCVKAKLLNDTIAHMKNIPYNALSVVIWQHECPTELLTNRSVKEVYGNLISKIKLKQFSVYWSYKYDEDEMTEETCILGQLILRYLATGLPQLERLQIDELPLNVQLNTENRSTAAVDSVGFLKLTNLKLPMMYLVRFLSSQLIQEVITSRAPNLQVLENELTLDVLEKMPPRIFGIIKSLNFLPTLEPDAKTFSALYRLVASNPRLVSVVILPPSPFANGGRWDRQRFWTLLWHLLNSSSESLESVGIDPCSIVMLTGLCLKRLQFPNVTKLEIFIRNVQDTGIKDSLLRLPMQNIFPSVTEISFSANFFVRSFTPPPLTTDELVAWPGVTKLTVEGSSPLEPLFEDFTLLFPCLESVAIRKFDDELDEPPFQLLWSKWPRLKSLEIGRDDRWKFSDFCNVNYDAEFCGIYPQEAEILREMDDEYLKAVHIVAPFPAINHVKSLTDLRIGLRMRDMDSDDDYNDDDDDEPEPKPKPPEAYGSFFLSKVTRFVAMKQQLRNFKLRLRIPLKYLQLEHVEHLRSWMELDLMDY